MRSGSGLSEGAFALSLNDDVPDGRVDRVHHAESLAVDVRGARGQFPQHDRRKPRAARRLLDHGRDPGVKLVLAGALAGGDRARAGPNRTEHVAQHLDVQPLLAAVVVIEHRLVDVSPGGNAIDAGGVVAALGRTRARRPGKWQSGPVRHAVVSY